MEETKTPPTPAPAGDQKQRPVFHVTDLYGQLTPSVKRDVLLGLMQWAVREISLLKFAPEAEPVALFTLPVNNDGTVKMQDPVSK